MLTPNQLREATKTQDHYDHLKKTVNAIDRGALIPNVQIGQQVHNRDPELVDVITAAVRDHYVNKMLLFKTKLEEWGIDPDFEESSRFSDDP